MTAMAGSPAPTARANALASGFDGMPWPEVLRGRPALVVPQLPGTQRPTYPEAGWSSSPDVLETEPQAGWALVQRGGGIVITAPGEVVWFFGYPLLTREWRRAATAQGSVILVSGPFATIDQFGPVARAGSLKVLLVTAR